MKKVFFFLILINSLIVVIFTGMLIIKLPHFTIPLIVRISDGGYGYDSTDLSALLFRIKELQRDWIVYITDAGQVSIFRFLFFFNVTVR
jgi:arginyl-tRNA synthetase